MMEGNPVGNRSFQSLPKCKGENQQDPDYNEAAPPDNKRLKYLEDNGTEL